MLAGGCTIKLRDNPGENAARAAEEKTKIDANGHDGNSRKKYVEEEP